MSPVSFHVAGSVLQLRASTESRGLGRRKAWPNQDPRGLQLLCWKAGCVGKVAARG